MADSFSDPQALDARGMAGPFGKFTEEVKTHLDERTHYLWLQLAASKGVTSAELQRDLIYLVLHQRTPAEMAADDRRALLRGEGRNDALERVGGGRG
ncbi:MAG TPA: hypothetical protein VIL30_24465 [Ramlibacter sp.]|jgi:hypothetical protein